MTGNLGLPLIQMKVLFIHNRYQYPGGEDVALDMECSILISHGHEVESVIFDNSSISDPVAKIKIALKGVYNPASYHELKTKLQTFKPDVVHIHNLFFLASPSVIFAANSLKIPVVLTLHNYRLICANGLLLRQNRICELCVNKKYPLAGIKYKCYRNSAADSALVTTITSFHKLANTWRNRIDRIIVLTEFAKERFLSSSLQLDVRKLVVKPNFVYDPGETKGERKNFFLFVGRLSNEKGVHMLLKSFADMPSQNLLIVGDGPQEHELRAEFGHLLNIKFSGKQPKDKVLTLMRESKALIFPSIWYEGLPYTILEAFSTGTPVIASELGAMKVMVVHGTNGYLFKPGDIEDLKKAINNFELNPDRERLYLNARQTYLEKYNPEAHYEAIMQLYLELTSN